MLCMQLKYVLWTTLRVVVWCVADYQLLVYGSKTHDAKYCRMCEELIVELGLQDNVKIMGLGKPTLVLPTGWVYLQVSLLSDG